jgi:hypothetical protein
MVFMGSISGCLKASGIEMLPPHNDASRFISLAGLAILVVFIGVLLWQTLRGDDITVGVRPGGRLPVVSSASGN